MKTIKNHLNTKSKYFPDSTVKEQVHAIDKQINRKTWNNEFFELKTIFECLKIDHNLKHRARTKQLIESRIVQFQTHLQTENHATEMNLFMHLNLKICKRKNILKNHQQQLNETISNYERGFMQPTKLTNYLIHICFYLEAEFE